MIARLLPHSLYPGTYWITVNAAGVHQIHPVTGRKEPEMAPSVGDYAFDPNEWINTTTSATNFTINTGANVPAMQCDPEKPSTGRVVRVPMRPDGRTVNDMTVKDARKYAKSLRKHAKAVEKALKG